MMDGRPFYSLYYAVRVLFRPVVLILFDLSVECLAVFFWILLYLGFFFFLLWLRLVPLLVSLLVFAHACTYGWECATGQTCRW